MNMPEVQARFAQLAVELARIAMERDVAVAEAFALRTKLAELEKPEP